MRRLSIRDRLASAFVGLFVGAVVGVALAWLFGVYSQSIGPARAEISGLSFILVSGLFFAAVGLLFGPFVGTLLGDTISLLFEAERQANNPEVPTWFALLVLGLVVLAVWWWLS